MWGRKMEQTIEALLHILNDTSEHDHLNFIVFDNEITVWKESLIQATPKNLQEAREFVQTITPGGSTDINDPLLMAVELLNAAYEDHTVPERSASMIVLLTDGEANTGESDPLKIEENAKEAINGRYTLYCLGFGYDVDYAFLEKLALENSGIARRIYEDSDADLQLQGFYNEIADPTLLNIKMQYPDATANVTQSSFKNYFEGSEIVVAGRVTDNDLKSFHADVQAEGAHKSVTYTENIPLQSDDNATEEQKYIFGDFTERLWAYLTIQQLLDKRVYADPSDTESLTDQVLELSLKFNFVTPLTSMVVTKPEENSKDNETLIADKFVDGQDPYYDPYFGAGPQVDSDPHFLINVPQKNDTLCFNIQEEPGVILNLIKDKQLGIAVNGELIGNRKIDNVISNETYFGKFGIVHRQLKIKILVTTVKITVLMHKSKKTLSWLKTGSISKKGFNLEVSKKSNVTFSFGEEATFVIILHEVWKGHPRLRDFLGFYTLDDHTFSKGVHGLLGQFFHGINYEISNVHNTNNPNKPDATMTVKNNVLTVTRGLQKDYRKDPKKGIKVPCWFVHSNGEGLIDGTHSDYIVPDIFSTAY